MLSPRGVTSPASVNSNASFRNNPLEVPPAAQVLPVTPAGTDLAHVIPAIAGGAGDAFRGLRHLPLKTVERVSKVNKVGRHQDRILVVTDAHLYTALPADGDVQRCMALRLITEARVFKARLEVALIVPTEYELLVQFYDPKALLRVLSCLQAFGSSSLRIIEEAAPINFQELRLEKPPHFARAPLPVPTTEFPPLFAKSSDAALHASRRRTSTLGSAAASAGADRETAFDEFDALGPEPRRGGAASAFASAVRRADAGANAWDDDEDGANPRDARRGTRAPDADAVQEGAGWQAVDPVVVEPGSDAAPSPLQPAASPAAGNSGSAAASAAKLRDPVLSAFDDGEHASQPSASPILPRDADDDAAASSTVDDRSFGSPRTPGSATSGRVFGGGRRGGGPRLPQNGSNSGGFSAYSPVDRVPPNGAGSGDGDDVEDLRYVEPLKMPQGSSTGASRGLSSPRLPSAPAAQPGELQRLRDELAAERAARAALAQDMAELLRAKADAEGVLRSELDTLRLTIERMSAEMLRLRRPWALDL